MSNLLTPATLEDIKPPVINKKPSTDFKRTQKNYDTKISSVLKSLQEMDDEDANTLGDFTPPAKPVSIGAEKKTESIDTRQSIQSHVYSADGLELNNLKYTYPDETKVDNYYKNYVPNYTKPNITHESNHITDYKPKYIHNSTTTSSPSYNTPMSTYNGPQPNQNILLDKINYMIHLLEEKHDLKTKSTFEEILLYCFLGIFTIFLVDSFSRVGKYIR